MGNTVRGTRREDTMGNNTVAWHIDVRADIFSKNFCEQLHIDRIKLPPVDQSFYYDLGIWVSSINTYDADRIRQYLFDHGSYRSIGNLQEEFDAILEEQFKPVYEAFKSLGYIFGNTFICAGGSGAADNIKILLFQGREKEYDKKGKLKKIITVHSNIPHGVGFGNLLDEIVKATKAASQATKSGEPTGFNSDCPQEQINHPLSSDSPITLLELFKTVAAGVAANASICTNELKLQYRILQSDPLLIESSNSKEILSNPTIDAVVCPQWWLYTETKDYAWNISEFPSGDDLQRRLLDVCRKSSTRIAVPFHNLKPVEYTLSAKFFTGYSKITLGKAFRYSDVQIMWNNLTGL